MNFCKHCDSQLLTISSKCYDMVEIQYNHAPINRNDLGYSYDGTFLNINYCLNCGKVDGNFPVNLGYSQQPTPTISTVEYINSFYNYAISKNDKDADRIIKILSGRLLPIDFANLLEHWADYRQASYINLRYPEFKEFVEWLSKNY